MTKKDEVIHSGHFMIANVHDGPDASATPLRDGQIRFDIDSSLQRLFTCMNEAYKNGVTTPRWKNFNGMKIRLKDRIRLNNAIWRCWHIEYAHRTTIHRQGTKPKFIQFITPLDSTSEKVKKPQVTLLEDNYWKKRNKSVVCEYLSWRKYYWKRAAENLKRQKESLKGIEQEPNFKSFDSNNVDAMVIDEGFFTEIYDSLHSHAMPDPGFCNPDMSSFGFETPLLYEDPIELLDPYYTSQETKPETSNYQEADANQLFAYKQEDPYAIETFKSPQMPEKQLSCQPSSPIRQYPRKQAHPSSMVQSAPPEKMRRVDEWPQQQQPQQQLAVKDESQKVALSQEGIPLNLEVLDQKGQVTLPNGQKVVLVSVMEDGTYMQIKGSKYGEKVIFKSQQESNTPPTPTLRQRSLNQPIDISRSREPVQQQMPSTSNYRSIDASPQLSTRSSTSSIRNYDMIESNADQATFKYEMNNYCEQELDYELKEVPVSSRSREDDVEQIHVPDPHELSAEQKRRFTMKKGFETLEAMLNGEVSGQGGSTGPKMSKAAVLNKAKDHIEKITTEQKRLKTEIDLMKRETDNLQAQLNQAQEQLPANGLPLAKPSNNKVMAKFAEYVSDQTRQNYKFYVFSRIMKRLFESYTNVVSTTDPRQLRSSTNQWVDVQCSISHMRQISAETLRELTKDTCIVEDNMIGQFPATCVQLADQEAARR